MRMRKKAALTKTHHNLTGTFGVTVEKIAQSARREFFAIGAREIRSVFSS